MATLNKQTRTLKLTRGEMCDIRLALTATMIGNPDAKKWSKLREKVIAQLDAQDPGEYKCIEN